MFNLQKHSVHLRAHSQSTHAHLKAVSGASRVPPVQRRCNSEPTATLELKGAWEGEPKMTSGKTWQNNTPEHAKMPSTLQLTIVEVNSVTCLIMPAADVDLCPRGSSMKQLAAS